MELDENIMQTRTVGQIVEVIENALDDMHPHSIGFRQFEDIIRQHNKAVNLLYSYAPRRKEYE